MDKAKTAFSWTKLINLSIGISAVLLPAMFVIGYSYYSGMLAPFKFTLDMAETSIYDIYIHAYFAIALLLTKVVSPLNDILKYLFSTPKLFISITVLVTATTLIYLIRKYLDHLKNKHLTKTREFADKIDHFFSIKHNKLIQPFLIIFGTSYIFSLVIYLIMLICLLWIILFLPAWKMGESASEARITTYAQEGCFINSKTKWSNCHRLIDGENKLLHEGLLVFHKNGLVAFFTQQGSFIREFPKGGQIIREYKP